VPAVIYRCGRYRFSNSRSAEPGNDFDGGFAAK
jgi:hypothetical protein